MIAIPEWTQSNVQQNIELLQTPTMRVTIRLLDVWETLLSFSKYFLSITFSQSIDNCSVAFSLLFSSAC